MNSFYRKVAVGSICTALSFTLGANTEAKAATFTLPYNITSGVQDFNNNLVMRYDGYGDVYAPSGPVLKGPLGEIALVVEFPLFQLFLPPNTLLSRAIVQTKIYSGIDDWELSGRLSSFNQPRRLGLFPPYTNPGSLSIFGFAGNGEINLGDIGAKEFLSSVDISSSSSGDIINFDVTSFVNRQISNRNTFSGFTIRALNFGATSLSPAASLRPDINLIVETAEPVPEPTTIFGSAIGLGLGGWLKRKKLSK